MYIDPNTGGMLFQVLATILAVFSGIALVLSGRIRAAIARFRRSVRQDPSETDTTSPKEQDHFVDSNQEDS
jgi:hypothetical protein